MKKSVIAVLVLSLMLVAGVASANIIGIFGDDMGTVCEAEMLVPYSTTTVHFIAMVDLPTMSACEFGGTGVNIPGTMPTVAWATSLVIGDIMIPEGVALAFNPPLEGPAAYLGSISYFLLAAQGENQPMNVVATLGGILAVVDGEDASTHDALGWGLLVNCTLGSACACDVIATEDTSWSGVKSLY